MTNFGVNAVSKVNGGRITRQNHHPALRGEGVHLLGIQINFQRRNKLVRIRDFALPLDKLAQPGKSLLVFGIDRAAVFVLPVRGDALFRELMHLLGAYLHFELHARIGDHRRMQRLV